MTAGSSCPGLYCKVYAGGYKGGEGGHGTSLVTTEPVKLFCFHYGYVKDIRNGGAKNNNIFYQVHQDPPNFCQHLMKQYVLFWPFSCRFPGLRGIVKKKTTFLGRFFID